MKVIVAGPPKTGTTSLAAALSELGLVVYDSDEQVSVLLDDWHEILMDGEEEPDFAGMFAGVDAITDGPAFSFWEQLLQTFPDARVILLTRDEDDWIESYRKQKEVESSYRWLTWFSSEFARVFEVADASEKFSMGSERFIPYLYRLRLRMHNERVRRIVPKDQLLEYSVRDGWGPLCHFLGVPAPETPFPHANQNASDYKQEFREIRNMILIGFSVRVLALASLASLCALGVSRFTGGRAPSAPR
ncbi:Hypothetical Protein FCC1311_067222 [Hondaea fermentalgiana]|uniref:Uncharacterized protein n=1 Tax=Hondaea fermentalgiana TaxID=2315210 RepID=A0A2R5GHZ0_9STRA|nr:Hypothetical Protein FCC1311_067222 [Hondaea fermentalgiana]|eukprot:GBG30502.1 Hypothetical Protein FCC1311_067222 [Hondaea fermentalgiana]